jgi:hypothetical protein
MIKLIATDMDDTLLDEGLRIAPGNAEALRAAEERGIHVVLASGRAPKAMEPYARELGMDRRGGWLIAYNGASIRECAGLAEEWGARLSPETAALAWDLAAAEGFAVQTYLEGAILVSRPNEWTDWDGRVNGIPTPVVSREEFISEPRVKLIIPGPAEGIAALLPKIRAALGARANCMTSKPFFLEILPPDADKGLALARLAAMHGVAREEVMAIGDAGNDLGMIRWAGVGVAMANATEEVRAAADWVTTRDHSHGGLAEAVERFALAS